MWPQYNIPAKKITQIPCYLKPPFSLRCLPQPLHQEAGSREESRIRSMSSLQSSYSPTSPTAFRLSACFSWHWLLESYQTLGLQNGLWTWRIIPLWLCSGFTLLSRVLRGWYGILPAHEGTDVRSSHSQQSWAGQGGVLGVPPLQRRTCPSQ